MKIKDFNKKIQEHKIFFWLIICYPVAIYRMIKYKVVPKVVSIIIAIIMTVLLFLIGISVLDMIYYPMRVVDNKLTAELEYYKLGTIREIEYVGAMTDDFGIYEVITTTGFYNVYFSTQNNEIQIEGIKELVNNKTLTWTDNLPKEYKDIPAPILQLFIDEKNYEKNIDEIEKEAADEYIITYKDKTKYEFVINYYKVYQIYDITTDRSELKYTCKTLIKFKKDFQKNIDKKMNLYKNVEEIVAYEVTNDEISYTFKNFCGNYYKIIKYNDNSFVIQGADTNISDSELEKQWNQYQKNTN